MTSIVIVCSFRRSGSHLLVDTLRRNFPALRVNKKPWQSYDHLYLGLDKERILIENQIRKLSGFKSVVAKTHSLNNAQKDYIQSFSDLLGGNEVRITSLYAVRDPRPCLWSNFEYWKQHRPNLRELDFDTYLDIRREGKTVIEEWRDHVECAVDKGFILVNYDTLLSDPLGELRRLERVLSVAADPADPIIPPRPSRSFVKGITRRISTNPDSTAILGRFSKKKFPSWKAEMSESASTKILDQTTRARELLLT